MDNGEGKEESAQEAANERGQAAGQAQVKTSYIMSILNLTYINHTYFLSIFNLDVNWNRSVSKWTGPNLTLHFNTHPYASCPSTITQKTCESQIAQLYKELDKTMKGNKPKINL